MTGFSIGDEVYYLYDNNIHRGFVKGIIELDLVNHRYLIEGNPKTSWMEDTKVFASIDSLIEDLKSLVIK